MQNLYLENTCRFPKTLIPQKAPEGSLLFRGETGDKPFFLEFTPVDSRILRLRVYENAYEPPLGDAVGEKAPVPAQVSQDDTKTLLKTEDFTLCLTHAPFSLTLENTQGQTVYQEQTEDVDSVAEGMQQIPPVGFVETPEGTAAALCPRLRYDEHIYGLGERFGEFDRRGQRIEMWNRDTLGCRDEASYKNIPFYLSSRGYGLFVNSRQKVVFSIGELSNASLYIQTPGSSCEYYFFVGSPAQVVSLFMHLTGPAVLPPDWSFGLWYSTGFQGASREAVMTDARIFREKEIPCDVLHFDCYWLRENMWCDFVWDDAQYPNRQEMLRLLHEDGFKVCLWMNPYVTICTEMYQEGAARASDVWNYTTVKRILKNPVYLGHTLLGRSKKISVKSKKKVPVPRDDWAVTENTHPPLVTKQLYERAQQNLGRGSRDYRAYDQVRKSIFSGIAVFFRRFFFQRHTVFFYIA